MDIEAREEEDDDILLGSDEEDFTNDYLEDESELSIGMHKLYKLANESLHVLCSVVLDMLFFTGTI